MILLAERTDYRLHAQVSSISQSIFIHIWKCFTTTQTKPRLWFQKWTTGLCRLIALFETLFYSLYFICLEIWSILWKRPTGDLSKCIKVSFGSIRIIIMLRIRFPTAITWIIGGVVIIVNVTYNFKNNFSYKLCFQKSMT